MKAPDKIYLQVCGDCPQTDCVTCKFEDLEGVTWNKDRIFPKDVEYTRTDAFINKACKWIEEGDIVMWRKVSETPVPFYKQGLVLVNEQSIMTAVNEGLSARFNKAKNNG